MTIENPDIIDDTDQTLPSDNLCSSCNGSLAVECSCTDGFGFENAFPYCPYCDGTGISQCPNCNGHHI